MPLPSPNLDDRSFEQLLKEARDQIPGLCPEWTDLTESDPGIVLLELFAYLTDTLIYRLNRVPDKVYIAFLNLLGVRLQPPASASTDLVFSRAAASDQAVTIPRGTRVTLGRTGGGTEAPVFITDDPLTIAAGQTEATVSAHHCDLVQGELAGVASGLPGFSVTVSRPPIIAPTGDRLDLLVGVEATPAELGGRVPAVEYRGKAYRIWSEVDSFTNLDTDTYPYIADRMTGTIMFAPVGAVPASNGKPDDGAQAIARMPAAGREVRLWYRRGGGAAGNVAANTLTALKSPIPGVQVTNPHAATGGRAAETLEEALARGPQQLHALERAITARDYELVARSSSRAIARAKAITRAAMWAHATAGTVEVLLVPYVPGSEEGAPVTVDALKQGETPDAQSHIQQAIDERRPLGTTCVVSWANYKAVQVAARVVVRREEDQSAVKARMVDRLQRTISPLPTPLNPSGWPFGYPLHVSRVYDAALAEPGVRWVDQVRLLVEEVPEQGVTSIAADAFQEHTWYVAAGSTLYRSLNDGSGWEPAGRFPGKVVDVVRTHPDRPGLLAVSSHPDGQPGDPTSATIFISDDCGEGWQPTSYNTAFRVYDLAWTLRNQVPLLLLATDVGLYELDVRPGGSPVPVLVEPANQTLGFYAVVAYTDVRGITSVAVAAEDTRGVYLSTDGGASQTFKRIGLDGQDVRVLAVRSSGPSAFLWAGTATPGGDDPGKGCFRWELRGREYPPEGWVPYSNGWTGGSCRSLAFLDSDTVSEVLAASHRAGVLRLDLRSTSPTWKPSSVAGGLPLRDPGRFQPVFAVAADPIFRKWVMAGGAQGVFRSSDAGETYEVASQKEFRDKVTLPETWLFVSGEHDIEVVSEDEAIRD